MPQSASHVQDSVEAMSINHNDHVYGKRSRRASAEVASVPAPVNARQDAPRPSSAG
ncbi:MAG TPA: hypothetical protein VM759_02445 [Longimicrobium sp.]|nr:hypothetical protein [Longimicrobium sp.]